MSASASPVAIHSDLIYALMESNIGGEHGWCMEDQLLLLSSVASVPLSLEQVTALANANRKLEQAAEALKALDQAQEALAAALKLGEPA
jgi:hypothetical protein